MCPCTSKFYVGWSVGGPTPSILSFSLSMYYTALMIFIAISGYTQTVHYLNVCVCLQQGPAPISCSLFFYHKHFNGGYDKTVQLTFDFDVQLLHSIFQKNPGAMAIAQSKK